MRRADKLEIERRYLVAMPSQEVLEGAERSEIKQTYLVSEAGCTERVRSRSGAGGTIYTHTVKRRLGGIKREEVEEEISAEEYARLLERADKSRRTIEKTRCCLGYCGQVLEIDIFPFWDDRAIMEIELHNEEQTVYLPEFISIIREISTDKRYTNASIALQIPQEHI